MTDALKVPLRVLLEILFRVPRLKGLGLFGLEFRVYSPSSSALKRPRARKANIRWRSSSASCSPDVIKEFRGLGFNVRVEGMSFEGS